MSTDHKSESLWFNSPGGVLSAVARFEIPLYEWGRFSGWVVAINIWGWELIGSAVCGDI